MLVLVIVFVFVVAVLGPVLIVVLYWCWCTFCQLLTTADRVPSANGHSRHALRGRAVLSELVGFTPTCLPP